MSISASFSGLTSPTGLTIVPSSGITAIASAASDATISTAGQVFFGWLFYYTLAS